MTTERLAGGFTLGTVAARCGVELRGGEVEFFAFDAKAMGGLAGITGATADFAFGPSVIDVGLTPFPLAVEQASRMAVRWDEFPRERCKEFGCHNGDKVAELDGNVNKKISDTAGF